MNPNRKSINEPNSNDSYDPYNELRTIPTGWDMSAFAEAANRPQQPSTNHSTYETTSASYENTQDAV
jgi:hypothetical protein